MWKWKTENTFLFIFAFPQFRFLQTMHFWANDSHIILLNRKCPRWALRTWNPQRGCSPRSQGMWPWGQKPKDCGNRWHRTSNESTDFGKCNKLSCRSFCVICRRCPSRDSRLLCWVRRAANWCAQRTKCTSEAPPRKRNRAQVQSIGLRHFPPQRRPPLPRFLPHEREIGQRRRSLCEREPLRGHFLSEQETRKGILFLVQSQRRGPRRTVPRRLVGRTARRLRPSLRSQRYSWGDSGDVYVGHFKNGLKHGAGEETYANGDVYKGLFLNGLSHGQGQYQWMGGASYRGNFQQGLRSGFGVWSNDRGDHTESYEGHFETDRKNGFGKYNWGDGYVYEGSWVDDQQHGEGKLFFHDQLEYEGYWQNGRKSETKPEKDISHTRITTENSYPGGLRNAFGYRSQLREKRADSFNKSIKNRKVSGDKKRSLQKSDLSVSGVRSCSKERNRCGHKNCIPNIEFGKMPTPPWKTWSLKLIWFWFCTVSLEHLCCVSKERKQKNVFCLFSLKHWTNIFNFGFDRWKCFASSRGYPLGLSLANQLRWWKTKSLKFSLVIMFFKNRKNRK